MQSHVLSRFAGLPLVRLLALVFAALPAHADNTVKNEWLAAYPNSTTDDAAVASTGYRCIVCHFTATNGSSWNAYGWKIRQNIKAGQSIAAAIADAGAPNSDLDPAGWSNLAEIGLGAQPGWTPGPHNTRYYKNSVATNQSPPAALTALLDPACDQVAVYCSSGTTSSGCVPSISASGTPRASASSGFTISVAAVQGQQSGLILYGLSGAKAAPWGTGTSFHCVKAPLERGPLADTGGTAGGCDGALAFDWNQFVSTHPSAVGVPFSGGETVCAQGWFRDPPSSKGTHFSNALSFIVCP